MRRFVAFYAALAIAHPVLAQDMPGTRMSAPPPVMRGPFDPPDRAITVMHELSQCLVEKSPGSWQRLLAITPGTFDENKFMARMVAAYGTDCLTPSGAGMLRGKASSYRGAIAEAVWKRVYQTPKTAPKQVKPFDLQTAITGKMANYRQTASLNSLQFAECVVGKAAPQTLVMLDTAPTSAAEQTAFTKLSIGMELCLDKGQSVEFTPLALRGALAEAMYRRSATSMAAKGTN